MYDSTIHAKTIARQFRRSDFEAGVLHVAVDEKAEAIERALNLSATGFPHASLFRSNLGGKQVYQHRSIEQALVVRHISENIRRVTGVKQSDRQDIVRSLSRIASQGVPFKALALDIKSFYESVDVWHILASLKSDAAFSRQSVHLLASFFDALDASGIAGLPRGLALSATLAEYTMRRFDEQVSALMGVFYYNRFVDDIIVITSADVDTAELMKQVSTLLPNGLHFSRSKSRSYAFSGYSGGNNDVEEGAITFLGYRVSIGYVIRKDKAFERTAALDIAPSKVVKTKTRIARALLDFKNGGSFDNLLDRGSC
ncbi:MAG: RNA-directed DNA polymerase [Cytophagaceae bacterium]|nr:MAG: RNA-directed DNA polymerase [Cytophagaceae bacterium]